MKISYEEAELTIRKRFPFCSIFTKGASVVLFVDKNSVGDTIVVATWEQTNYNSVIGDDSDLGILTVFD